MSYGRFAVEREETLKKIKNELILNLDKFQHLEHFWHININLIFFRVSSLSTAERPYIQLDVQLDVYMSNCPMVQHWPERATQNEAYLKCVTNCTNHNVRRHV